MIRFSGPSSVRYLTLIRGAWVLPNLVLYQIKNPEQRHAMMNSGQFQAQFTPQERQILGNILAVEPYLPRKLGQNNGLEYGRWRKGPSFANRPSNGTEWGDTLL